MSKLINKILHQTRDIYNAIAGDFSSTRGKWWKGFGNFSQYVKPGDSVLDLGCGNGRMADIFSDSQVSYLGLDNSEELIKIARKRFENNPKVKFEAGDILDLHLEKGKYSLVLLIAVLHHIPTKELRLKVLRDVFSCLKPGGRLVMSNWNLWEIFGSFNYRFRYWKHLFNF
ncbi:MAG: class I SAM-dependent methyltransferase, partial [Patescibacteria group bacterium]